MTTTPPPPSPDLEAGLRPLKLSTVRRLAPELMLTEQMLPITENVHPRSPKMYKCLRPRRPSRDGSQLLSTTSWSRSSVTATGSSQCGHGPPKPSLRMKVPHSSQRCWPTALAPQPSHS